MPTLKDIAKTEQTASLRTLQDRFQATSLRHLIAAFAIRDKYKQLGEFYSGLGLPTDSNLDAVPTPITLRDAEGGYKATFRGGQLKVEDLDQVNVTSPMNKVKVWFVGLECQIRQEGEDEMYGSVDVIIPSTKQADSHHFPEGQESMLMGKDGARITELNMLVYDDEPADIILNCVLAEHDSGNIDTYKKKMAEALAQAAKAGLAAVGVPAEATAADQGFIGDLSLGLVNALSGWVGADDDVYNPRGIRIPAKDILIALEIKHGKDPGVESPFQTKTLERADTPGVTLKYNVGPAIVSGTDQGGDTGRYAFYFNVEPYFSDITR